MTWVYNMLSKIIGFCLKYVSLILLLEFFSPIISQIRVLEGGRVFFKYTNQPLNIIIEDLREKTGKNFVYKNDLLKNKNLTCKIDSELIKDSFSKFLKGFELSIKEVTESTFVVVKDELKQENISKYEIKPKKFIPDEVYNYISPVLINRNSVLYPQTALNAKIQGEVKILAFVTQSGKVSKVRLSKSSGYAILDNATMDFVKNKEFLPAYANGKPVSVWTSLTFKYNLKTE